MRRVVPRARAFVTATALAIASVGFIGSASATAATTWHVTVGPVSPPYTSLNAYYVNDLTVHPGDKVEFDWVGFHTVTFNPQPGLSVIDYAFLGTPTASTTLDTPTTFVNGVPAMGPPGSQPPPFLLTIGNNLPAGSYSFWCQLHQFMHGVIHVTNGALPRTDAENQALAATQIAADLAKAARLDNELRQESGDEEGSAIVGAGSKVAELLNFYPGFWNNIVVRVGQKLTFKDADNHDPHTVTFGPEANPANPFGTVAPYGNPNAYDGTSPLNSGFLFHRSQYDYWNLSHSFLASAPAVTKFTVTFNQPGLFPFYCAIHGGQDPATGQVFGMSGHILVVPAESENSG